MHLHHVEIPPLSRLLWRGIDVLSWLLWCVGLWYGVIEGSEFASALVLLTVAIVIRRYVRNVTAYCTCRFLLHLEPADNSNLTVLTLYSGGRVTRRDYVPCLPSGDDPCTPRERAWPILACLRALSILLLALPVCSSVGAAHL